MRIVLLTAHTTHGAVQHRYVATRLFQEFGANLTAIIVATGTRTSLPQKIRRWRNRYTPREFLSKFVAQTYRAATGADVRRQQIFRSVLFPDGEDGKMPRAGNVHLVPSHNGSECLALLQRLNPDVVVVYGTLIIGKKVISSCKRIINLHTGFSPIYRGSDTIFWALHNGDPDNVGVTVHRLDAGVDSGAILARGKPSIEPEDDENRLFAKGVKLGAELLCRAIKREVAETSRPMPQRLELGREYRSVERTLGAELRTREQLKRNLLLKVRPEWSEEH
jgi:hypothetical protein